MMYTPLDKDSFVLEFGLQVICPVSISVSDKLFFGPVWDFNFAYGSTQFCEGDQYQGWQ